MPDLLTFEREAHLYRFDGNPIPSVTQAIRLAGLGTDYSGVPKVQLEEASMDGRLVHHAMGSLLLKPPTDGWDRFARSYRHARKKIEGCVRAACSWLDLMWPNLEILEVERPYYSAKLGYAGTLDFVALFFGKRTLFEWKTTADVNAKSAGIQTAGYELLYEENEGRTIDQRIMIHLRPRVAYWDGWQAVPLSDAGDKATFLWALREAFAIDPEQWTLYGAQRGEV